MLAVVDSVLLGGVTMSFFLGRLTQQVKSNSDTLNRHVQDHKIADAAKGERDRVIMALAGMIRNSEAED